MKTPIYEGLKKHINGNYISFHTPGHKGRNFGIDWKEYMPKIDLTELHGLDNLQEPRGIILESQKLASKAFNSLETFYSINGTTGGLHIALGAVTAPNDEILIQRNSHTSIYNGAILNRLKVEYIYPNYNNKYKIFTGIDPSNVESILKGNPNIKVVVITYPTYYGICCPLKKIAEIVHSYDKILLVDEAHGSHFAFSPNLPSTALELGADIVVQSTHKTLPSLTQSSMIHVGSHRVNIEKLKEMCKLYQSTSPSYLLMASLDAARAYMEGEGSERLNCHLSHMKKLVHSLNNLDNVTIFTGDEEDETISDFDITKLLLGLNGMRGTTLQRIMREKYKIQLEMADYNYGLFLTTLMNSCEELNILKNSIVDLNNTWNPSLKEDIVEFDYNINRPKVEIPLGEAFFKEKREVELRKSVGEICGNTIIPYPPGIPLIVPGELITNDIYEEIKFLKENHVEIVGLLDYNEEKITVVK